jgi:hypothetical protein
MNSQPTQQHAAPRLPALKPAVLAAVTAFAGATLALADPVTNTVLEDFALGAMEANLHSSGALQTDEKGYICFVNIGGQNRIGEVLKFDVRQGVIAERLTLVTDASLFMYGSSPIRSAPTGVPMGPPRHARRDLGHHHRKAVDPRRTLKARGERADS